MLDILGPGTRFDRIPFDGPAPVGLSGPLDLGLDLSSPTDGMLGCQAE